MDNVKRAKLKASGWTIGSTQDFLGLSAEEAALVELRLALSRSLRTWRTWSRVNHVSPKWKREIHPCRWIFSFAR